MTDVSIPSSFVVGVTGGIAAGKSAVKELFSSKGVPVLDADKLGHDCYKPGSTCLAEVLAFFGSDVQNADGTLNRAKLGALVFGNDAKLRALSEIVWPHIRTMLEERLLQHRGRGGLLVVEAAVLLEAGWEDLVDEVWVVYASRDVARVRLMDRNGFTADEAEKRIQSQVSNEVRLAKATHSLRNDASREVLQQSFEMKWQALQQRILSSAPMRPLSRI